VDYGALGTPTPALKAAFNPPVEDDGIFELMTLRADGQFNTTIYNEDDRFRGVYGNGGAHLRSIRTVSESSFNHFSPQMEGAPPKRTHNARCQIPASRLGRRLCHLLAIRKHIQAKLLAVLHRDIPSRSAIQSSHFLTNAEREQGADGVRMTPPHRIM
jgi:hypothetical protein